MTHIPDLLDYKTMLYVGAHVRKSFPFGMRLIPTFRQAGYQIDVLEPYEPNIAELNEFNSETSMFDNVVHGSVLNLETVIHHTYDVIVWRHGPEHVMEAEIPIALKLMEIFTTRLAVIFCPRRQLDQGAIGGNPYQIHCSVPPPELFLDLGWAVAINNLGREDRDEIMAWRRINA